MKVTLEVDQILASGTVETNELAICTVSDSRFIPDFMPVITEWVSHEQLVSSEFNFILTVVV